MGIPTAITGFCFWLIQRKLDKREKRAEQREEARKDHEILLVKSVGASIALGEAVAIALKNQKCNGETEAALEYAKQIKHEQKDFLTEQGINAIF